MNRTLAVARLHLIAWPRVIGLPWLILSVSFAVNLALFATMSARSREEGMYDTGGSLALYIVTMVVTIQSVTRLFPLASSLGSTRAAFYAGSCLTAACLALGYGVLLTGLLGIERATDGWGAGMRFFGMFGVVQQSGGPLVQVLAYTGPLLLAAALGLASGAVYQRWSSVGTFVLCIGGAVVMGAVAWWITWTGVWTALGHWLREQPGLLLSGGVPALVAVLFAGAGFAVLRRTAT